MLQALKTGFIYSFFFQEREHMHRSTLANTKPSALIHTPSNLQYCCIYISTNIHGEIRTASHCVMYQVLLAFHFNNSPPALMVIRYVSRQPLNLETLFKCLNTKKKHGSNLAEWETECECAFVLPLIHS